MRRIVFAIFSVLALSAAVTAAAAGGRFDPVRAAGVATGFVSHQLCSAVFVSGLDAGEFYAQAVEPTLGPAAPFTSYRVDRQRREVTARLLGLSEVTAVFRDPGGCVIAHDGSAPAPIPVVEHGESVMPAIAGPDVVTTDNRDLQTAIARAFDEPVSGPHRRTKAVVIVHEGRIIAERYAPGYGPKTPIFGWSMTKSATNALIGVLVRKGKLRVDQPAPIAAWNDPADPRHAITIDQLLRMESGLDIGQSLFADASDAFNPASQMLYDEPDMVAFTTRASLHAAPGSKWNYANGNTMLLSAIIRDQAEREGLSVLSFAHRELFDLLGMERVTLETDEAGTPVGSSHMSATPRDWAKFGLLYLNDGVIGGRRILPAGWVDYSARPTSNADEFGYGAGFWTNRGDGAGARRRTRSGMPADSFMARGTQGQYVVVVPSRRLIVVRMGYSMDEYGDIDAVSHLVGGVVAAIDRP